MIKDELVRRIRRARFQVALAVVNLVVGAFVFLIRDNLFVNPQLVLLVSAMFIGLGLGIGLMSYLRGDIYLPPLDNLLTPHLRVAEIAPNPEGFGASKEVADLAGQVRVLQERIKDVTAGEVASASKDREALISAVRKDLTQDLALELSQRFSKEASEAAHVSESQQVFAATSVRLLQEIASQTRRGNLNLTIGVLTTAVAVSLLTYMVFTSVVAFGSLVSILSHYIPRITTVVFVEVFSFFFLGLYKSSLTEIKFYQNELTTMAAQQIALEVSRLSSDPKSLMLVLDQIARRNPNAAPRAVAETSGGGQLKSLTELLERVSKLVAEAA